MTDATTTTATVAATASQQRRRRRRRRRRTNKTKQTLRRRQGRLRRSSDCSWLLSICLYSAFVSFVSPRLVVSGFLITTIPSTMMRMRMKRHPSLLSSSAVVGTGSRCRRTTTTSLRLAAAAAAAVPSSTSFLLLHVDEARPLLSQGTRAFPPMVSTPCTILATTTATNTTTTTTAVPSTLQEIIQPPNVDELYDWYVSVQQNPAADPSWAVAWPSAVSLCNYLLTHADLVRHKTIIELGSGLGLCGLVCGTVLESTSVLLSDKEPFALHCALSSAAAAAAAVDRAAHDTPSLNLPPPSRIQGAVLDWCDDTLTTYDNTAEVILASDVLYDTTSIDAFATICHRLLRWRTRPQDPVSSATAATSSSSSSSSNSSSVMLLVTDPKIERTVGARKQFTERLLSIFQPKNDDEKNPNGNDTTNTTKMTIEIDVLDLPSIPTTSSSRSATVAAADTIGTTTTSDKKRQQQQQQQHEEEEGITFDGKDHYKRMKEDTVLIRCIITIV